MTHGFTMARPQPFNVPAGQPARNFKEEIRPLSDTPRHVFTGFTKCCYPLQRFQSDPERRFAVLIDAEHPVDKWMKPGKGQFQSGEPYEPDFVVELTDQILICEVKRVAELTDPTVKAKASAATKWCRSASEHATSNGGKPWAYLLIPDDQILANTTIAGLRASFTLS